MKKTLALVLALAMVFSTITVAFAEDTLGADAQICADLGMLKGETGSVDEAYVATAPTRLQAAIMFLRLKGLETEALAFTGEANFADADQITWAGGKAIMAYLKANPQLGWQGDGTNFKANDKITAQQYYKVLLETLGYKQTTAEVMGDFTYEEVLTFAASVGLSKVAAVTNFTVNDLATATVEALKVNVKDTEKTLVATLVEAGKIAEKDAVDAGLVAAGASEIAVAVDEATAAGNAQVDVVYEDDVDAAAAGNIANYTIEGLAINAVTVTGSDSVRLDTEVMTSGKIYKLTVGEKTVQFTGIAKVSGGPEIDEVEGVDVEEVVITFTKNIDQTTGTDVANYSIAGVTIVAAEIDPDDQDQVILTTEGLKNKTKYTVKVTNVKSVDGVAKKSDSDSFTTKYDLVAPKIDGDIEVQTNQRIVVNFSEKISKETAEDLANYSIKVDETDGASLEVVSVTWDDDDEDNIEIVTEAMDKSEDYELSVSNIADQRKVPNVMSRTAKSDFEGEDEDDAKPTWTEIRPLSPTTILITFEDESKIDEESALDLNNYDLEDLDIESIETIKDEWKIFKALLTVEEMETGESYELTIVDVLDEFGNALKEKTMMAKGISSNFAAVAVESAIAIDENTIEVVFNDELDEDTAENIANYDIDEEVGAPTEAVYEYKLSELAPDTADDDDKQYIVTLTTNDLVNGYENAFDADFWAYDLTVDGVQDLAGNELVYEIEVDTVSEDFDDDNPELEDVDVLNNEVVALSFDEAVLYGENAVLNLTYLDANKVAQPVALTAMDYSDDFTVIEFSGAALAEGTTYTVVDVVYNSVYAGITDLIGNPLADIEDNEYQFVGVDDTANGAVEVDTYEQTNSRTFEVTFTRFVQLHDSADTVITPAELLTEDETLEVTIGTNVWDVTYDDDVVTFELTTGILDEDVEYKFDLTEFIVDKHLNVVENADSDTETELQPDYTDEDEPYVEEVVALDRETIKITFSEEIVKMSPTQMATFLANLELVNYDLDEDVDFAMEDGIVNGIDWSSDNDGDNVIKLKVDKLESRYEYELTVKKNAFVDYAGKANDSTESFYFDGTNMVKLP